MDRERLDGVICRVSDRASDLAAQVVEIDINPLICNGADIVAVDALVVLQQG